MSHASLTCSGRARSIALALALFLALAVAGGRAADRTRPVQAPAAAAQYAVLITLDGLRTEEMFGGLDLDVLRSVTEEGPVEATTTYERYWAPTREERRRRLMPFFWGTLMTAHGSIAGDRSRGSRVTLANRHRFSYPGYAEILTGAARDEVIDSNDNRRYPFPTVLEFLKDALGVDRKGVAVFGSWETFNWIAEHEEGALNVNAGYEAFEGGNSATSTLSQYQFETRTPWDTVRHDMYTFRLAASYLASERPRVLYLALGETDDWAHGRRYDRTLQALELTDTYVRELWTWLQADAEYRDRTAILITVDHGRGHTPDDWHRHGEDVEGAQETWLAAIGPAWPRRGAWEGGPEISTSQVAATLARALGEDYPAAAPEARPAIDALWRP